MATKRGRPANSTKSTTQTKASTQKVEAPIVKSDVVESMVEEKIIVDTSIVSEDILENSNDIDVKPTLSNIPNRPIQNFDKYNVVNVINNFNGPLTYISSVTGYGFRWDALNDVQQMPIEELINMRNGQPAFYKNNWIEFDKDISNELKRFLHVEKHYENSIRSDEFEDLFKESPEVISESIAKMPINAQDNLARLAVQMIEERKLDSLKIIDAIEDGLGYKITETV